MRSRTTLGKPEDKSNMSLTGARSVIQNIVKLLNRFWKGSGAANGPDLHTERIMTSGSVAAIRIRPLKDQVILYVDESPESREAVQLLYSVGISPFVTNGAVGPLDRKPLVIYHGGFYRGMQEIKGLVDLLGFWSNQPAGENQTVFRAGV